MNHFFTCVFDVSAAGNDGGGVAAGVEPLLIAGCHSCFLPVSLSILYLSTRLERHERNKKDLWLRPKKMTDEQLKAQVIFIEDLLSLSLSILCIACIVM